MRKRHGPLAADAVAKAAFVPPLPTIKPVTNWAKLGQFPRWIKLGRATGKRFTCRRPDSEVAEAAPGARDEHSTLARHGLLGLKVITPLDTPSTWKAHPIENRVDRGQPHLIRLRISDGDGAGALLTWPLKVCG